MVNNAFRALAHPIRRGIVERLGAGTATVHEATQAFSVSKPAITKHLKVLEEHGVITREIQGRRHVLHLNRDSIESAGAWFDQQRALWIRMFDTVDEYLNEVESGDE